MFSRYHSPSWVRLATATLLAALTACSRVMPIASPRDYVMDNSPNVIWVSRNDGPVMEVDAPGVLGDTLTGHVSGQPVRIPFSEITSATVRHGSSDKLVKYSVGVGAAIVATVLVTKVIHQPKFPNQTGQ